MSSPQKPLRILLLTWIFSDAIPGGDTTHSWQYAVSLARLGVEVFVLSPHVQISSSLPKNFHVYKTPFGRLDMGFTNEHMLLAFLFGVPLLFWKKIDVVHVVTPGQMPSFFAKWKIRPFLEDVGAPWDYADPRYGKELERDHAQKRETFSMVPKLSIPRRMFRKLAHLAYRAFGLYDEEYPRGVDLWVCESHIAAALFAKKNPDKPFLGAPLGYDHTLFKLPETAPAQKDTFTFINAAGSIGIRKGIHYLIPAFRRLSAEHPEARLLIVGQHHTSAAKEFIAMAEGDPSIVFHDPVPPPKMARLMQQSDAIVVSSLGEPFGIAMLEGAACGLPIIATNAGGGPPEVVEDGRMGYLVEPASADALYAGMKKIIADKKRAREMGIYAAKVVREKYTWDAHARIIIEKGYYPLLEGKFIQEP